LIELDKSASEGGDWNDAISQSVPSWVYLFSIIYLLFQFEIEAAADGYKLPFSALSLSSHNLDSISI
jgi:hypothetical protein